ncbi:hypothetical protein LBMAG48_24860 [Phycisphaerae bacterium]|nr:hypothetical protein LBMAG48_24860 [Phycisphaerae bacterium]
MGLSIGKVYTVVHELPDWAIALYRGRCIRRLMQLYVKANPSVPALALMEQVAREHESAAPDWTRLATIQPQIEKFREQAEHSPERRPLVGVSALCVNEWSKDIVFGVTSLPEAAVARITKEQLKRDEQLVLQTIHFEAKALLKKTSPKDGAALIASWNSLWPKGTPLCLQTTWMSEEQQAARVTRMWMEDAPETVQRPATMHHLASGLSGEIVEAIGPLQFEMVFEAAFEAWTTSTDPSVRALTFLCRKATKRTFTFHGEHLFREPSDEHTLQSALGDVRHDPRFESLVTFYTHHDGALLFHCKESEIDGCLAVVYGLEDQSAAREEVKYWLDYHRMDEPGYHTVVLSKYDTCLDEIIVVAAGGSFFVIPLRGAFAGQMIRLYVKVNRHAVWAKDFAEGLKKLRANIHRISLGLSSAMKLGDEEHGGETALSLVRVKRRIKS